MNVDDITIEQAQDKYTQLVGNALQDLHDNRVEFGDVGSPGNTVLGKHKVYTSTGPIYVITMTGHKYCALRAGARNEMEFPTLSYNVASQCGLVAGDDMRAVEAAKAIYEKKQKDQILDDTLNDMLKKGGPARLKEFFDNICKGFDE